MAVYGILFDQSKCIGCKACEQACQVEHGQRPHEVTALDHESFNWVQQLGEDTFTRQFCKHCLEPTCVSVCPVGALEKTADGPVIWLADRCMGCRYCMMACPFGIPKYEWRSPNPRVCKCDMCVHRVTRGLETGCASVCPTGATQFGERAALLAEAKRRLAESPKTYFNHIFGEHEVGGTSTLYLVTKAPAEAGLPTNIPRDSMPQLTWRVLGKLPQIIPVWAVVLGGLYWLTERKHEVKRHEAHGKGENHG